MGEVVTRTDPLTALPVLPLKNSVLFPYLLMPLVIGRPRSMGAVEAAINSEDKALLVLTQKDPTVEEPTPAQLHPIGTVAVVKRMERAQDQFHLIVQGAERVEVTGVEQDTPYLKMRVRTLPEPEDSGTEVEALHAEVLEQAGQIHQMLDPQAQLGLSEILGQIKNPLHQVYLLASLLGLDQEKEQALLAAPTRTESLRLMHGYLAHELQVRQLRQQIASQTVSEMNREQREHILRQQLRTIQQELGEQSPE